MPLPMKGCPLFKIHIRGMCGRAADHPAGPEVAERAAGARLDGQDRRLWRGQDPAHRLPDHAEGHGHLRLGRAGGPARQAMHGEGKISSCCDLDLGHCVTGTVFSFFASPAKSDLPMALVLNCTDWAFQS